MHVDFDYFYAQCEENRNPSIRDKPVVVCVYSGRTEESGVVSTSNYLARKFDVRAGVPIARAKKLLEPAQATFLPMDRPYYEQVSERLMEILKANADSFEKVGIDEAYLDISTRTNHSFEQVEKIAADIKEQLLTQEKFTCSIGAAPNKLVAKIASDEKKPNGLTIVRPEGVSNFLGQLPANRIPGVGKKVEEKLGQLHVQTVTQLATVDPTVLIELFGRSLGSYLFRAARGEDDDPVQERGQPVQLSRIATLKHDTRELSEVLPILEGLTDSVTSKLKQMTMTCRTVAIIAILNDLTIHSRSKTLEQPTSDETIIRNAAQVLLKEFLESKSTILVRRAGVRVAGLSKPAGQTDISKFITA